MHSLIRISLMSLLVFALAACGDSGTTPADPTNPTTTDPTDSTDATDPTDSTDPTNSTDPTDATDPTNPDPTDPAPTNQPPTVSIVGSNPRKTAQNLNYLTAEVSDPDGDSLSYLWEVITDVEEDVVTIAEPTEKSTSVTFAGQGDLSNSYTIRLTVDDGNGGTTSDTVEFIVYPYQVAEIEIEGANPRTAAVGEPIELVADVQNLQDLILETRWSVAEGSKDNVAFNPETSPVTSVTFSEVGSYTLQASVYSGDIGGDFAFVSDTVVINVE